MKKRRKNNNKGFTLVELMVVAVIVAILAAVAIPVMTAQKKRAMSTEAEAAMGMVRSVLRAQLAETGSYIKDINGNALATGDKASKLPTISTNDLNGRYFNDANYILDNMAQNTYTIKATGDGTSEVANVVIKLNESGVFTRTGL